MLTHLTPVPHFRSEQTDEVDISAMDRRLSSPRFSFARIGGMLIVLSIATLLIAAYVRYGIRQTLILDAERIVISTVRQDVFREYIPLSGSVQPRDTAYVDAVHGGQVAEVLVEEGSLVSSGQPLVRLSNTALQLQVFNSEAQLAEQLNRLTSTKLLLEQTRLAHSRELIDVRFKIAQAEQQLARIRSLGTSGAVKRADIEDAELELQRLERLEKAIAHASRTDESLQREQLQQLDQAVTGLTANLDLARQNLENLVLKAPIGGQLTSLEAHVGESKSPGERIGQVDRTDAFKISAFMDEYYLARAAVGQRATAMLEAQTFEIEVTKVYPEVRDRRFKIDLAFTRRIPTTIRRGQTLEIRLELGASTNSLVVDNGTALEEGGGQFVYVLLDNKTAELRAVTLGRRNPEAVEVLEGLAPQERVITSSSRPLKGFKRIELRGHATAASP